MARFGIEDLNRRAILPATDTFEVPALYPSQNFATQVGTNNWFEPTPNERFTGAFDPTAAAGNQRNLNNGDTFLQRWLGDQINQGPSFEDQTYIGYNPVQFAQLRGNTSDWTGALPLNTGQFPSQTEPFDFVGNDFSITRGGDNFNQRFQGDFSRPMEMDSYDPSANFPGSIFRGMDEFSGQNRVRNETYDPFTGQPYGPTVLPDPGPSNYVDPRTSFERSGGIAGLLGGIANSVNQGWGDFAGIETPNEVVRGRFPQADETFIGYNPVQQSQNTLTPSDIAAQPFRGAGESLVDALRRNYPAAPMTVAPSEETFIGYNPVQGGSSLSRLGLPQQPWESNPGPHINEYQGPMPPVDFEPSFAGRWQGQPSNTLPGDSVPNFAAPIPIQNLPETFMATPVRSGFFPTEVQSVEAPSFQGGSSLSRLGLPEPAPVIQNWSPGFSGPMNTGGGSLPSTQSAGWVSNRPEFSDFPPIQNSPSFGLGDMLSPAPMLPGGQSFGPGNNFGPTLGSSNIWESAQPMSSHGWEPSFGDDFNSRFGDWSSPQMLAPQEGGFGYNSPPTGNYVDMLGPTQILRQLVEENSRAIDNTGNQLRYNVPGGQQMTGTGNIIPQSGGTYFAPVASGGTSIIFTPGVGATYGW